MVGNAAVKKVLRQQPMVIAEIGENLQKLIATDHTSKTLTSKYKIYIIYIDHKQDQL